MFSVALQGYLCKELPALSMFEWKQCPQTNTVFQSTLCLFHLNKVGYTIDVFHLFNLLDLISAPCAV